MRKRNVLFCVLVLLLGTTAVFAESTPVLHKTAALENYEFRFTPLESGSRLAYEHEGQVLSVYRQNPRGEKEKIGAWKDVQWGDFQISRNAKRMVFTTGDSGYYRPTYFVDGEKGMVTYLFDAPNGYITDGNLRYMLGTDHDNDRPTKAPYNEPYANRMVVYDLERASIFRSVEWQVLNKWGSVDKSRSKDSAYDFRLIYDSEGLMYADAFYNVDSDTFTVVFDVSSVSPECPLEYNYRDLDRGMK